MPLAETRSFASAAASVGATSDSDVSAPANVDGSSSAEADATEPPPVAWLARRDGEWVRLRPDLAAVAERSSAVQDLMPANRSV